MAASQPGVFNPQQFTDAGLPAAGYRLYTYTSGTTTHKTAFTDAAGVVAQTYTSDGAGGQYIGLNSRGELPAPLFLTSGAYDLVLKTSAGATVWTRYAVGLADGAATYDTAIRADLADTTSTTKGAGMVGYSASQSYGSGTVGRKLNSYLDAAGDGYTTLTSAATAAASAGRTLYIGSGTWNVAANLTISVPVVIDLGATIVPATGVTVTFGAGLSAGVYKIFDLAASGSLIAFTQGKQSSGFCEWWGAISGNDAVAAANLTAINAALVALRKIELLPADYYVSSTVVHAAYNGELVGAGSLWNSTYGTRATRIIVTNGTDHAIRVGASSVGASPPSTYPQGLKVRGISFTRNTAPLISSGCTSVRVTYALEAEFVDVRGDESMNGWEFVGTTACKVVRCSAKRTSAGGTPGTDSWKGFYVNGLTAVFAGGNASLYLLESHADDTRATTTGGNGFYIDGSFTDCFMVNCETVSCVVGVNIQGLGSGGGVNANTDLRITNQTNDAFTQYGVLINDLGPSGSVEMIGGYQGPASGATASIRYQSANTGSSFVITGGVCQHGASTSAIGISASSVSGLRVQGTQIQECATTCVALSNVTSSFVAPVIKSSSASGGAGVQLSNTCTAVVVAPQIYGKASTVTLGIQVVGTADARNTYDIGGIDSGAVAGGYTNKCTRNGSSAVASATMVPTYSGTNLVTGCSG